MYVLNYMFARGRRVPAGTTTQVSRTKGHEQLNFWVFITGGCSGRGVQWIGVVLCNKLVYNSIQITTPCFHCKPLWIMLIFGVSSPFEKKSLTRGRATIHTSIYMCVCVYIYVYIYIYTHTYTHIYAYTTCIHICIYLYYISKTRDLDGETDRTANLRTTILDFRGFDSGIILILRGEIPGPTGKLPESLGQRIFIHINICVYVYIYIYIYAHTYVWSVL